MRHLDGYAAESDPPAGARPPRDTGVAVGKAKAPHQVHISRSDDWVELFLDGIRVHAAHSFTERNLKELLERLGVRVSAEYRPDAQDLWGER